MEFAKIHPDGEIGTFIGVNHIGDGLYQDEHGGRTLISKEKGIVLAGCLNLKHYKIEGDWPLRFQVAFNPYFWWVCPIKPKFEHTKSAYSDRTPGFLVRSSLREVVLALAVDANPDYEFTGEVIPYMDYVPGLSLLGALSDLRRWVGVMNNPDSMPLGTVIQMD